MGERMSKDSLILRLADLMGRLKKADEFFAKRNQEAHPKAEERLAEIWREVGEVVEKLNAQGWELHDPDPSDLYGFDVRRTGSAPDPGGVSFDHLPHTETESGARVYDLTDLP